MSVYPAALPTVRPAVRSAFEQGSGGGAASIIAGLFAQGQQGFWLPFTDFASLSQDSAGTLPYTAVEQPVGRVLDRSGRGNHASQATSTARGVVSARVNLLTKTNAVGDPSAWALVNGPSASIAAAQGPDGTYSMTRLIRTGGLPNQRAQQTFPTAVGAVHTVSYVIQKDSAYGGTLYIFNSAISVALAGFKFEWAGSAPVFSALTGWVSNPVAVDLGNGQFRVTASFNSSTYSSCAVLAYADNTVGASYLLGLMDIRLASQSALPYQRVNTPTDYDAIGFPKCLRLDGTDDFYTCGGGGAATGFFFSDVVRIAAGGITQQLVSDRAAGSIGWFLEVSTTNRMQVKVGNGSGYDVLQRVTPLVIGGMVVVQSWMDATTVYLQVNDELITMPRPAGFVAGSSTMNIGGIPNMNGTMVEPIYRAGPPPSAYERGVIRAYQMQKAGML